MHDAFPPPRVMASLECQENPDSLTSHQFEHSQDKPFIIFDLAPCAANMRETPEASRQEPSYPECIHRPFRTLYIAPHIIAPTPISGICGQEPGAFPKTAPNTLPLRPQTSKLCSPNPKAPLRTPIPAGAFCSSSHLGRASRNRGTASRARSWTKALNWVWC